MWECGIFYELLFNEVKIRKMYGIEILERRIDLYSRVGIGFRCVCIYFEDIG